MAPNEAKTRRNQWLTLIAMTLSSGMILVDQTSVPLAIPDAMSDLGTPISNGQWILTANMLPLAAFMVVGGRLGDIFGLRKVFLVGALIFSISSAFAGFAQDFTWMVAARASQGIGAALMMPTAVAIVSSTFAKVERGKALGILAGFAAFLAALGPVIGGGLATLDWRLVFLVNVPLAIITVLLTLRATPPLRPRQGTSRKLDFPGLVTFGIGISCFVYGLGQGQTLGWTDPQVLAALALSVTAFASFGAVEHFSKNPMIEFRLFRHDNFLAANISQFLAGMIELGTAYLLPYFLLTIIGVSPLVAGIALIPSTVPIILAGPLAGKWFDKVGGRMPLVIGFLTLSLSGLAMAFAAPTEMYVWLIPGLVLQGIGLGIVLTVNDPTGLSAVPAEDQGQAAGVINTTEQLGGAVGIAVLSAIMIGTAKDRTLELLGDKGINPTAGQQDQWKDFMLTIEQKGLKHIDLTHQSDVIRVAVDDVVTAHTLGYELMFFTTAGIGLLGALVCWSLVRKTDRIEKLKVFSRRSSWQYANTGRTPALTRQPAPGEDPSEEVR